MKLFKLIMLFLAGAFMISGASAQSNAQVNILSGNGGVINLGGTQFLEVSVGNTGPASIGIYKVRTAITVPGAIASIPVSGHSLPAGWTITSNTGTTINLSNGTDVIPANEVRTILIALQGNTLGGPSTIVGQLSFSNGNPPGTGFGTLTGDNPADNNSTTSVTVAPALSCTLGVSALAGTIACNGGTTTLTATPTGANGTVEYSITGGAPYQASNVFTVPAGTYTVTAREVSNTGCTATSSSVTVAEPTPLAAFGAVSTPIPAIGGQGAITVTNSGGTPGGTAAYVITSGTTINTTGASTGVFTGLLAGTYTFTVTKNGCTSAASANVVLNDPAACILTSVSAVPGTIACNGGTTTITATPVFASGSPTVQYRLNAGAYQSSNVFTGVAAGTYTVTAREVSNPGCTATSSSITVTQPTIVGITGAITSPIAIPGGTGEITFTATGGTPAYEYNIISGPGGYTSDNSNGVFSGLFAGSYTAIATDANNCTSTSVITVLPNPGVATADPAVGQMYFTTTSGGVQNANTLLLAPATDLYDINIPFYNLNQLNQAPAGTINFTINLGKKLVLAPGFSLATAPLNAYFTWTSAVVGGNVIITGTQSLSTPIPADFDGVAKFRVKGDSACRSNVVSNIVITNALQSLVDDDLNNNQATLQYTLPITLTNTQVNVTCNGAGNGIVNVVVSSGTTVVTTGPGGYTNTRNIASGVNSFTLSGLAPGTYTITATAPSDGPLSSCTSVNTVIILQPTVLAIPGVSIIHTDNNCFNAADGTITVAASGGTAPYTYTIAAGPTVNTTGALNGIFTGLTACSYTVTVTDNNGCTATTAAIVITQPVGGIPDISLGSDYSGNLFAAPGVTHTIVYNISEIAGNSAVGDTLRITKVAGFTINFNPTIFSTNATGTLYALDNPRWKIDNTNPAFVSIILTDPLNTANPGTLLCNQRVNVAVTVTRNTSDISIFPLSARLRKANGEVFLLNNLNSIVFTAE